MEYRLILAIFVTLLFGCGEPQQKSSQPETFFSSGKWVDLTHAFGEDTIYWPTADGFQFDVVADGETEGGYYYAANNFATSEHGGTHLDAPVHFAKNAHTTEAIPLNRLMGPAAVIDVSAKARENRDYLFTIDDVTAWESQHGRLPDGIILLFHTGFGQYWPDAKAYLGTDGRGPGAVADLHFPGLSPELAQFLVDERNMSAVGLDTPSIDYGQSTDFISHRILFAENIPGFENVANLDALPPTGAFIIALPMKIKGGSGGPLRIVAYVPE